MKLKYYLRGLGVGIVCTAIIMGIATSGKSKEKLTDAEIIERARLLGMVMVEDNAEELDEEEVNDNSKAEEPKDESKKDTPKVEEPKDESKKDEAKPEEPKDESKKDESKVEEPKEEKPAVPEIKTIEVLPGEYSDVVSRKLLEAGLIKDAEAFNKYLTDTNADQNIMPGTHQIPMGATEEEIIRILGEKAE